MARRVRPVRSRSRLYLRMMFGITRSGARNATSNVRLQESPAFTALRGCTMPNRLTKLISAAMLCAVIFAAIDAGTTAQEPKPIPLVPPGGQPDPNALPEGAEVLARG